MSIDREALIQEFEVALDDLERALRQCPDELWDASVWAVKKTDPWVWPAAGTDPVPERTEESIQRFSAFWIVASHCLFFLDFYVTRPGENFAPPENVRGGPEDQGFAADGAVAVPDMTVTFSKDVLLGYLDYGRRRMRDAITAMTDEELATPVPDNHPWAGSTVEELLRINVDHVKEHGRQLLRFVEKHASPVA